MLAPTTIASRPWVDEAPGHGADVVEELQGGGCVIAFRAVGEAENPEVDVDLLRGSVGDLVVVEPVPSGTPVAFGEIRRDRRRCPYQLITDALQWCGYLQSKLDCDLGPLDGLVEGVEPGSRWRLVHGHLRVVHALRPAAVESDVKGRRRGDSSCP